MDGGWQCWLPSAPEGLHPPWLPGFWRHLDEAGGQFWQAEADQQRAWWSRPCKLEVNPTACCPSLAPLRLERVLLLLWCSCVLLGTCVCICFQIYGAVFVISVLFLKMLSDPIKHLSLCSQHKCCLIQFCKERKNFSMLSLTPSLLSCTSGCCVKCFGGKNSLFPFVFSSDNLTFNA